MAASVEHALTLAFEDVKVPALFIYHPEDKVVKSDVTQSIATRWGSNTSAEGNVFEVKSAEDRHNHVIAGRILSPSNSQPVATKAIDWIKALD